MVFSWGVVLKWIAGQWIWVGLLRNGKKDLGNIKHSSRYSYVKKLKELLRTYFTTSLGDLQQEIGRECIKVPSRRFSFYLPQSKFFKLLSGGVYIGSKLQRVGVAKNPPCVVRSLLVIHPFNPTNPALEY